MKKEIKKVLLNLLAVTNKEARLLKEIKKKAIIAGDVKSIGTIVKIEYSLLNVQQDIGFEFEQRNNTFKHDKID